MLIPAAEEKLDPSNLTEPGSDGPAGGMWWTNDFFFDKLLRILRGEVYAIGFTLRPLLRCG